MEVAGLIEIAALERNAKILSVIAHIAPLIGLLGTVLGFIQAFSEMRMSGLVDISANRIGEAMEYALVTTAAGLVVAIPSVIAYNYIVSRVEGFVLEKCNYLVSIVDLLNLPRRFFSMKFKTNLQSKAALVDLTPLVDVIFLMLIFFIVTSDILPLKSLSIENPVLPKDAQALTTQILVVMDAQNVIYVGSKKVIVD